MSFIVIFFAFAAEPPLVFLVVVRGGTDMGDAATTRVAAFAMRSAALSGGNLSVWCAPLSPYGTDIACDRDVRY
eukprot:1662823-Rhodomonas_salina.2